MSKFHPLFRAKTIRNVTSKLCINNGLRAPDFLEKFVG